MAKIRAQILLPNKTKCSNPNCNGTISNPMTAIFVVRVTDTRGFCCPQCYDENAEHYLHQVRATKALKGKSDREILKQLGYIPGVEPLEE